MTNPSNEKNLAAYELLGQQLESVTLPPQGDSVAVFRPLRGEANEEYRETLNEKLGLVFGRANVSVGNAIASGGIEVTIRRGVGMRAKIGALLSGDTELSR